MQFPRWLSWMVGGLAAVGGAVLIIIFWNSQKLALPPPQYQPPPVQNSPDPVFCTQDAMQCPDGSFVGRIGPACEFAPCPGGETKPSPHSQINRPVVTPQAQPIVPAPSDMQDKMVAKGVYLAGSSDSLPMLFSLYKKPVLFFHAPWCPFCKAADAEFSKRTSEIPSGVAVIKVDYDSHAELKKKYGVTYQHTFVQVDSHGNLITKWNGGDIENLKKYLR